MVGSGSRARSGPPTSMDEPCAESRARPEPTSTRTSTASRRDVPAVGDSGATPLRRDLKALLLALLSAHTFEYPLTNQNASSVICARKAREIRPNHFGTWTLAPGFWCSPEGQMV